MAKMWNLYVTILILGFTSGVYMETCPTKESVWRDSCVCKSEAETGNIQVDCRGGLHYDLKQEDLAHSLKKFSKKNNVDLVLRRVHIPTLSTKLFDGIGIKKLRLYISDLDSLYNDDQPVLEGLKDHLEELVIEHVNIKGGSTSKFNLGHLKKLKTVKMIAVKGLTEVGNDWFGDGPVSLETLILLANDIEKIGSNAFSSLTNLKELELKGNDFGAIKRSMLPTRADRLKILNLSHNDFTYLPEDIFHSFISLSDIDISHNQLTTLEEGLFHGLNYLSHIDISLNQLTTLDEGTWTPIWRQLEVLRLENNKIPCDDRLKWTFNTYKRPIIVGYCASPDKTWMDDFIKEHSRQ